MARMTLTLIGILLLLSGTVCAEDWRFTQGGWTLVIGHDGDIASLRDRAGHEIAHSSAGSNLVQVALLSAPESPDPSAGLCSSPSRVQPGANGMIFEYDLATQSSVPLLVRYEIAFSVVAGFPTVKRTVVLMPKVSKLNSDVRLLAGNNIAVPGSRRVFAPRYDGIGEEVGNSADRQWEWALNGGNGLSGPATPLAIPMISDGASDGSLRVTHIADPYFATGFRVADPEAATNGSFTCVYTGSKVPMRKPEERTFWTVLQTGGPEKAMDAWYAIALADIPPGPDWLHDVAWQHYDYMSYAGKGWFEDIDALEKLVPKKERSKVVFTLHGWFDVVGRYTFNQETGRLDDEWTGFPNIEYVKDRFATSVSIPMTKAEVHQRIRYAKDRGFRVLMYFADGVLCGSEVKDVSSPDLVLRWGGWIGPDTRGYSYVQDPSHPRVRARCIAYLKALLQEYGTEMDGLVWDETYMVRVNWNREGDTPAYAPREMMRLVRDCTLIVHQFDPDLAFLTSDCIGLSLDGKTFWTDIPPYAIMSHGCYQDSHSMPWTWPYGIFPNYRNTLWSCNWWAVTNFKHTVYGVEHYRTPVATSNGFIDAKGIARLTPEQLGAVMDLFNKRKKQRQQLHWLSGPPPEITN